MSLDVMEGIIEAIYTKDRAHILESVNLYIEKLRVMFRISYKRKYLIRYMDDMVLFSQSKDRLKRLLRNTKGYLGDCLRLTLNGKATVLNSRLHGLPFLGFRVFPNLIRIKRERISSGSKNGCVKEWLKYRQD